MPATNKKDNKENISLLGAISMGTGVMIGAGIFALTGEIASLAGNLMLWALVCAGLVSGITSYTYIKMCNAYPSSGGIAMILKKAYGKSTITAWASLLMFFSMVINQSLVARTFGNYIVQIKGINLSTDLIPWLGAGLILFAFLINVLSNKWIQGFSFIMAIVKILGLLALALGGLYISGIEFPALNSEIKETSPVNFIGAIAIGILAFKGFTTITNSGGEIKEPHKNVGRAIIISLGICLSIYVLVMLAVGSSLNLSEILEAKNYSLAEAARPGYGEKGVTITVIVALIATVSGIIASMFAVSRMLAMLTKMELVPHSHLGMPGSVQKHTLVYTAAIALIMTIIFDVGRIAALGALFYIVMDLIIHYGVLTKVDNDKVKAMKPILILSIVLDIIVLIGLLFVKVKSDISIVIIAFVFGAIIWGYEFYFLRNKKESGARSQVS